MFTFKVETRKLKPTIQRLSKLDGVEVDIGFFEDDMYGPENGNLHVAQVAFFNEYGTSLNPTRPFMQDTLTDKSNQLLMARVMVKIFQSALTDGRKVQSLMKSLGEGVVAMMQDRIMTWPGSNSVETIRRKGRNAPLRDTEVMLNSIKFKINKKGQR